MNCLRTIDDMSEFLMNIVGDKLNEIDHQKKKFTTVERPLAEPDDLFRAEGYL